MKECTLCALVFLTYLASNYEVKCSPVQAERSEAPYLAYIYYSSGGAKRSLADVAYTGVLVRPTMIVSGHCCGEASYGEKLVVRVGALRPDPAVIGESEQERTAVSVAKLQTAGGGSAGVALVMGSPFDMTSTVGVAALPVAGPAPGQTCVFYYYSAEVSGVEAARRLRRSAVRALSLDSCSGQHGSGDMLCFGGFEAERPDEKAVGGAVWCSGHAVALAGGAAPGAPADAPRLLLDLALWRQLAQCDDVDCLTKTNLGTGHSWSLEPMMLVDAPGSARRVTAMCTLPGLLVLHFLPSNM